MRVGLASLPANVRLPVGLFHELLNKDVERLIGHPVCGAGKEVGFLVVEGSKCRQGCSQARPA